jgi:serine/threonine-protein kinase
MAITDPIVLPADVLLEPVSRLSEEARHRIVCDDDDFAISRPRTRVATRIIDAHAAALIGRFRTATTIVEAVIAQAGAERASPDQYLEDAIPLIERMMVDGFLVAADSPEAKTIVPTLAGGTRVGNATVGACLQQLADVEVYQARTSAGTWAALKIARADSRHVRAQLDREARILQRLGATFSPALLDASDYDGRPYLLLEWCNGVSASVAADDLRDPRTGDRGRLLALCSAIARAYARLHERGVIHSDVHPRNILVDVNGRVRLIDFGISRLLDDDAPPPARAGIAWYFEPEYASARLEGRSAPPSSPAGEQYGLGALLYELFTGNSYVDFALDKVRAFKQMVEASPLRFTRRGCEGWPDVERVLTTALAKAPADRFASVGDLADALESCAIPSATESNGGAPILATGSPLGTVLESWLARLRPGGELFESGITVAPMCSVNNGSAGVAVALYRMAVRRDDAKLLALADIWAERALADSGKSGAFYGGADHATALGERSTALFHSVTGVQCARGLIALARADNVTAQGAIDAFVTSMESTPDVELDLTTGRAGLLLGASLLYDAMPTSPYLDPARLRGAGDRLAMTLWAALAALPPVPDAIGLPMSGIAHGWAGVLYAVMRWAQSTRASLPNGFDARLHELASCAEETGRGIRWPRVLRQRLGDETVDYVPSWCNGSAGFIHLWTLASSLRDEPRWLELAERVAWNAWEYPHGSGMFDLCCGAAGRAYALLTLHRHTGDATWLRRAESLADRAGRVVDDDPGLGHALYKGSLGVALLAAELDRPLEARMPLFEHEGWPERA